jgi:hypothetical protein
LTRRNALKFNVHVTLNPASASLTEMFTNAAQIMARRLLTATRILLKGPTTCKRIIVNGMEELMDQKGTSNMLLTKYRLSWKKIHIK